MKKKIITAMLISLLALSAAGCSAGGGTPPVLTVDGVELTLGESSPGSMKATEYNIVLPGNQMPIGKLPARSWMSPPLSVGNDDCKYADFYVYNPGKEETYILSAPLSKVTFKMHSEKEAYWAENNVLVNGMDFFGKDSPAVKEMMADYKLGKETESGILRYEDGDYQYFFHFDEESGLVSDISVEKTFAKGYDKVN